MRTTYDPTRTPGEIRADLETQIADYDARRDQAAAAIRSGRSAKSTARRFGVPIGFCRNIQREQDHRR